MNEIYDSDNTRPNMYRLAVYLGQLFSKKIIIDQPRIVQHCQQPYQTYLSTNPFFFFYDF